ncbi:MAG: MBL fold metallo-hydrolase [Pseudomonadota bacterium]|nr:MBL fold metallo-hydrolase [Pseudomonadota bacterium]
MRKLLKRLGTGLLFIVVALCFAPTLVPPFLDRIYYQGQQSAHFDGTRFFNPGFPAYSGGDPRAFLNRWIDGERATWPASVPVAPTRPPARVDGDLMRVTWIGHATVLVQADGLNILSDPIWAERASPFDFVGPKRVRAPGVRFDDLPKIDIVLISHNHYDHMDVATLKRLWDRDQPHIFTSLGNDAILRRAGIGIATVTPPPATGVVALDWNQGLSVHPLCTPGAERCAEWRVTAMRNHHWSSRWGSDRNRALWSAFTVRLPGGNIFFAGDTGWGDGGWVREAAAQGPYRLAILPIGAYEPRDFMKTNHVNPEEAVRIFEALKPTRALGVHWGTFQLTFEPIDEPRQRLEQLKRERGIAPGRFVAVEAGQTFAVPTR